MYIDFIADYGEKTGMDDLAFSEVDRKLVEEFMSLGLDMPMIKNLSVHPFNTIETGFVVAQLAKNSKLGIQHIIYHNTAPRKDELSARKDNEGEFLAVSELSNGVRVIGVYGGYTFAFLAAPVYKVKCATAGSQFRSRDVFPPCVASLAYHKGPLSDWSLLGEKVCDIPKVSQNVICSIDGYGNIKTNIVITPDIKSVIINNIERPVVVGDGIFSAPDGTLILAPGSSGWDQNKCTEICLRGGSAALDFKNPKPGDLVILK